MELHIYEYKLPLKVPFKISGAEVKERFGLIFEFIDDTGTYYSEAAPLNGFSNETLEDLKDIVQNRSNFKKRIRQETLCCLDEEVPPSLKFAISSLWFQHQAKKNGKSFGSYLEKNHLKKLQINTTLGLVSPDEVFPKLDKLISQGFLTFKLKVGRNHQAEIEIIKEIRKKYPSINIRLDANQAWTPQEALDILNEYEPYSIEYCEQPISKESIEAFAWLKNRTRVKLAADESVRTYEDAKTLIKYKLVDLLILKPMFIGSVEAFQSIARAAKLSDMQVTVTTALESGVGRRLVATLASTILFSPYAHGLATGSFFLHDILNDDHLIENGTYKTDSITDDFINIDRSLLKHVITL